MKYIGTKTVNAVPMTAEVAENKGYKVNNHTGDGYEVEYEDGYKSWSPKDVFDKAYRCSDTWNNRAVIEIDELNKKIDSLAGFIGKDTFWACGQIQCELMERQLSEMKAYRTTLAARLYIG